MLATLAIWVNTYVTIPTCPEHLSPISFSSRNHHAPSETRTDNAIATNNTHDDTKFNINAVGDTTTICYMLYVQMFRLKAIEYYWFIL